jgi:uncharacterized protein (TIGR03663 family)
MNASEYLLDDRDWSECGHANAASSVALPWLTVEVALYSLLGVLALVSRFYALGDRPLTAPEATQALHAWQATSGPGGDALAASPLLFAGQALTFALLGASDGAARLLPALAGTVLVVLPYLLRHRLGQVGALATSALLLISPTLLFTSREASGDVLLLTAGLAAVVGLVGWVDLRQAGYLYLAAVSAALALAAAPGVYTFLVALAAALALPAFLGRRTLGDVGWSDVWAAWRAARGQNGLSRTVVALFLGTLVLLPTTLLLHPEGLQAVADLFLAWITHFAPWAGDQPVGYPLAVLGLYEPLLVVFGLAGAVMAFRRRDLLGRSLAVWAGVALCVALLAGGRGPGDVLLIVGPLAILAGDAVGKLLEDVVAHGQWVQDGLIVGVLVSVAAFCYIELASYAVRRETTYLWLAIVSAGLFVGVYALYAAWFGRQEGWRGGGLVLLALLSAVTVSFSTNLAYRRAHDPRELLVVEGTSPAVRDLPALLEQASMQRLGATEIIPITVDEDVGPVVRWYLRDFRHQTWLPNADGPGVMTEAVVTPWKPYEPELGAAYFGGDFVVRTTWQPRDLSGPDRAGWFLYRRSPDRPQEERVVLWLRWQED